MVHMGIHAEEFENTKCSLQGFFRFEADKLFSQAVLAVTNEALLLYSDNKPDLVNGADWTYKVKTRVPLEQIKSVTKEVVKAKTQIKDSANKIVLKLKNNENPMVFFYNNKGERYTENLLSQFRRRNIKTKTVKSQLAY